MALPPDFTEAVARAAGARPLRRRALGGGCVGEAYAVELADGRKVAAKVGHAGSGLALEGWMLRYLARNSRLPVPEVLAAGDTLLVMSWIDGGDTLDARAQGHAAELLAGLHAVTQERFGLERDTLIGGLHQPNAESGSWIEFFRDQRLLYMARVAFEAGSLPAPFMGRIERLAARLEEFLIEPAHPALLHGDMWGGNILARNGRIAGFVDPAIYYGSPEIELAFSTMFGTFGAPFFARYRELAGLEPGFFETRRDLYNLYPLLVHVRLFGGGYVGGVDSTLSRFGF